MKTEIKRQISDAINDYESALGKLRELRERMFPVGSIAIREKTGVYGVVAPCDGAPTFIGLTVQSGNTWCYPFQECRPIKYADAPDWMKRMRREMSAAKGARTKANKKAWGTP